MSEPSGISDGNPVLISKHKKVLLALSLEFRRLGAAVLIQDMEGYKKNSLLSGAPLFIGANGKKKGKEKENSKKRSREPVDKEWLAEMQPQLKRLAGKEKPESIALKIARNMLLLPPEIIEIAIDYMLRPVFIEPGPVETKVSRLHRMGAAMKEYQLRKTAYIFLLDLTNKHLELKIIARILSSDYRRQQTYAWWFRKQTIPLWVGNDRYAGPAFSESQAKKYALALPVGAGEHEGWYNHFLANVMFHWHLSEMARETWSAGLAGHKPDKYIAWPGALSFWDSYPRAAMELRMDRSYRTTESGVFGGASIGVGGSLHVSFAAGNNLKIPKIINKQIIIRGLPRRPVPETQEQSQWHGRWHYGDDTYPLGGPRPKTLFEQAEEKLRRQYVIQIARIMFHVTVLRMPTILWDFKKYGSAARSDTYTLHQTEIKYILPDQFAPYFLFDAPLRAYNPSDSFGPWVFDLVERPIFDKRGHLFFQNLRFLSLTNAQRGISRWIRAHKLDKSHIKMLHVILPRNRLAQLYLPDRKDARDLVETIKHRTSTTTRFEVDRQSGYLEPLLDVTTGKPIEKPMNKSDIRFRFESAPSWLAIVRSPGDPVVKDDDDDDDDSHNIWD